MSKKDDSPAISLFSFQDIITSITGIMFLVVLLLMLLIFESHSASPASPDDSSDTELREIRSRIVQLRQMLKKYQEQDAELKKLIEQHKQQPMAVLEKRRDELTLQVRQQRLTAAQLEEALNTLQSAEKSNNDAIVQLHLMQRKLSDELKTLAEQKQKNEKQLEILQKSLQIARKTVKFSVEESSDKRYLLAEFGEDGFRVLDFADKKTHDLRRAGASEKEKLQAFLNWMKGRDRYSEAVSVIIGPGKLKEWNRISAELKSLHFAHGLELYPADGMSIFSGESKVAE